MFSIIIPLYNKAPYIEKALRSIQAQTYREFEVIIIDDGSTDNSLETANQTIAEISNDSTVSPPKGGFRGASQINQGVSVARNNGVKLANYPYICFLDADDWWAPTFLEEMKALIEEFPDAGIYGTNYYIVKNGSQRIAPIGVPDGFEKGEINYCQVYAKTLCMPLWTGAVCVPKTIFESEKGFKPKLKLGEDFDLWVRIAMKNKVVLLNKPLAYYNQDVELNNRALKKVYPVENNYLWDDEFRKNYNHDVDENWKRLLDNIRVTSVFRYYLSKQYRLEARNILDEVDWNNVSKLYNRRYNHTLYWWLKIKYFILWDLSARKNRILKKRMK